ncbi:DUF547 domain-containing protein [Bythopirellula polymerisocia]|uniref:DUF547 domain-containing protein n=1 Tax=Bythopirellula polymerisocia TaxID=2528003 RepID=A0A5C6CDK9_9BACT|nr:DUF547 domain-containing protein [Bythopirellula polymerisocia]TWU22670.1 hypothetical protein Pla144_41300 [Bythopirellula polymerisocia]
MSTLGRIITLAFLIAAETTSTFAASPVTLGKNLTASERIPIARIDHVQWDTLVKKYVNSKGMVDYERWQKNSSDMQKLDRYLDHLSEVIIAADAKKADQLAFWINAYNAVTVKGILREYPTTSIRNHTAKFFGYNIWDDLQLIVDGKSYSLNQMEHEVLRKMQEPRIHFAIVCASIGCPRLLNEAYVPSKIDQQLTSNAKAFFADPTKFNYDKTMKTIAVSPILDWFSEDFGPTTAEQMQRIAPFVPKEAHDLAGGGQARVSYLDYDWDLNDQAKK